MIEIWADEACTVRPDSLAITAGETVYLQINRSFGVGQEIRFIATEEEQEEQSQVAISSYDGVFDSYVSIADDKLKYEGYDVIEAGEVFRCDASDGFTLLSFSLGPVISNNPTIVPESICSVPMYYDSSEQVWMYAIACLNSNREFVFLEAANDATKVHVTTQLNDGSPVYAFEPSPLPALDSQSGDVPFAFSAAYARQYGKHAPYSHRLVNITEVQPGSYSYALQLLVNNTAINSVGFLVTSDESPIIIEQYH